MDIYKISTPKELIEGNSYAGRGIIIGKTPDNTRAVAAYFIMGRSANSRNRVFEQNGRELFTKPFDPAKVEDPKLIIYAAIRQYENHLIVTNGDQTDTVYEGLKAGKSFEEALNSRCFEPDAPNFTPRISGMITFKDDDFSYKMSILKSIDEAGTDCARYYFAYPSMPGLGHFIHTYVCDGSPLPTFTGEPSRIAVPDDIEDFAKQLWSSLDEDNRISLYVRSVDLKTKEEKDVLINKYER